MHIQNIFQASEEIRLSALLTFMITLIFITPVCGFLFQCGCTWPWLGLDSNCNFYQANVIYKCPWCVSMPMGIFATGFAITTGIYASSLISFSHHKQSLYKNIICRVFLGVFVFLLIAILMAGIAVLSQNYPLEETAMRKMKIIS